MFTTILKRFYSRKHIMDVKTFIFLDCETTGLPAFEGGKTKITELCLIAIDSDHLKLGVFPRVQNKLSFCYNPKKFINPEASSITGLYNDLLEHQPIFNENVGSIIKSYLQLFRAPICFVAHNGNRFDYPILRKHCIEAKTELADDILCIDSLEAFKALHEVNIREVVQCKHEVPFEFSDGFDDILNEAANEAEIKLMKMKSNDPQTINETTPKAKVKLSKTVTHKNIRRRLDFGISFKLCDVYSRLMNKEPINAHRAECDVDMMLECAATLGEKFVMWANKNARRFNEITPI